MGILGFLRLAGSFRPNRVRLAWYSIRYCTVVVVSQGFRLWVRGGGLVEYSEFLAIEVYRVFGVSGISG